MMECHFIIAVLLCFVGYAIGITHRKETKLREVTVWFPDIMDSNEEGENGSD